MWKKKPKTNVDKFSPFDILFYTLHKITSCIYNRIESLTPSDHGPALLVSQIYFGTHHLLPFGILINSFNLFIRLANYIDDDTFDDEVIMDNKDGIPMSLQPIIDDDIIPEFLNHPNDNVCILYFY
jgi:hypothetical protein